MEIIKASGLKLLAHFVLPVNDWMDDYYLPLKKNIEKSKKENGNTKLMNAIRETEEEINLFENYSDQYGYVFYICKNQ